MTERKTPVKVKNYAPSTWAAEKQNTERDTCVFIFIYPINWWPRKIQRGWCWWYGGAVSKENPGEAKENSLQYLPFGDIQFYNCSRDVTRRRLVGLSEKHSYGA